MELTYIYGVHAVTEALKRRSDVVAMVYASEAHLADADFRIVAKQVKLVPLDTAKIPKDVPRDAVHQGLIAAIKTERLLVPYKVFRESLRAEPSTAVVVLGEVQDPHNVGAIIRSSAALGAAAVCIPEHRQAPITGTVIKVSAGMAFSIPLVSIGNVNQTLRDLKGRGFWVYGLGMEGNASLHTEHFERPSVFVVGNEGNGLREKTSAACDSILTIPMHPRAESLNASISTAVALYAWSVRHPEALYR